MERRPVTGEERIFTLPNFLSVIRLLGVPAFLWLILTHRDGPALAVLVVAGVTDYLDGKIARTFGLVTRLGEILDPVADRLYILAALLGLAAREVIPWWFVVAILARDAVGTVFVQAVRRFGYRGLPVHFVGKAATFCLLYAFPLVLLGQWHDGVGLVALPLGWAFAWWGLGLYWVAVVLYGLQARDLIRAELAGTPAPGGREVGAA